LDTAVVAAAGTGSDIGTSCWSCTNAA